MIRACTARGTADESHLNPPRPPPRQKHPCSFAHPQPLAQDAPGPRPTPHEIRPRTISTAHGISAALGSARRMIPRTASGELQPVRIVDEERNIPRQCILSRKRHEFSQDSLVTPLSTNRSPAASRRTLRPDALCVFAIIAVALVIEQEPSSRANCHLDSLLWRAGLFGRFRATTGGGACQRRFLNRFARRAISGRASVAGSANSPNGSLRRTDPLAVERDQLVDLVLVLLCPPSLPQLAVGEGLEMLQVLVDHVFTETLHAKRISQYLVSLYPEQRVSFVGQIPLAAFIMRWPPSSVSSRSPSTSAISFKAIQQKSAVYGGIGYSRRNFWLRHRRLRAISHTAHAEHFGSAPLVGRTRLHPSLPRLPRVERERSRMVPLLFGLVGWCLSLSPKRVWGRGEPRYRGGNSRQMDNPTPVPRIRNGLRYC